MTSKLVLVLAVHRRLNREAIAGGIFLTLSYYDFKYLLGYQDSDNFLVRNIFAEGKERTKTCKEFLSSIVFEDLDHESIALMPFFLSHNGDAVTGGNLNMRIRGIHKWSMCKNSLNLSGILPLYSPYPLSFQ